MDILREVRCDAMYRLTNEVLDTTLACGGYHASYRYDKAGNRTSLVTVKDSGSTTITYSYNANDQLLEEVRTGGGAGPATTVYGYDANGSLTNKVIGATGDEYRYNYNLQNRLREVVLNGSASTTYLYNDQGIRVRAGDKRFLVDAQNHTGYAQVLGELTVQGSAFAVSRSYTLGDDVLSQSDGTGSPVTSHLLYDGHGSTRLLNGSGATVASRYDYDAYGVSLSTLDSGLTTLLYAGEQFDSGLQMYYLRARYYDPSNGRFNQRDDFAGNNFDPQSLHKYAYAHNDPVNRIDPSGEFTLLETAVVLVIMAALVAVGMYAIAKGRAYVDARWRTLDVYTSGVSMIAGTTVDWNNVKQRIEGQTSMKVSTATGSPTGPRQKSTRVLRVQLGSLPTDILGRTVYHPLFDAYDGHTTFDENQIKSVATAVGFQSDANKMSKFIQNIVTHEVAHAAGIQSHTGEGGHPSVNSGNTDSLMYANVYQLPKTEPPVFRSVLTTQDLLLDAYSVQRINSRVGDEK